MPGFCLDSFDAAHEAYQKDAAAEEAELEFPSSLCINHNNKTQNYVMSEPGKACTAPNVDPTGGFSIK